MLATIHLSLSVACTKAVGDLLIYIDCSVQNAVAIEV